MIALMKVKLQWYIITGFSVSLIMSQLSTPFKCLNQINYALLKSMKCAPIVTIAPALLLFILITGRPKQIIIIHNGTQTIPYTCGQDISLIHCVRLS